MTGMLKPKINTKTPAPPAPLPKPETPKRELGGERERTDFLRKKKGRNALRIDPQVGGVAATRQALNVPMK